MKSDEKIISDFEARHKLASQAHSEWRKGAKENFDFVAGRQYTKEELDYLEEAERTPITFNRVTAVVESVTGHYVNNRTEARYLPRETGDVQVSEVMTGAARWADDECDAEDELTDAFFDLAVAGMAWTETRMDYTEIPEGKLITAERVPCLEMEWDHRAKKRNVDDAKWVSREKWWDKDDVLARWPDVVLEVQETQSVVEYDEDEDEFMHENKEVSYSEDVRQWYDSARDRVRVVQFQWWDYEPTYRVAAGDRVVELTEAKWRVMGKYITEHGLQHVRMMRKKFYQAYIVGRQVAEKMELKCGGFTLRCATGKRDYNNNTWLGLVEGMKDPSRWSNKFFADMHDIIASNRRGGAFVEVSALVDQRKAEEQWNSSNPLILVNDGALGRGAVMERQQMNYPMGMDRLMQLSIDAVTDVPGINMELLGLVDRNQPGVLEMQRKRAALTILQTLFDSMRRHTKERGRVVLRFIKEYISDGRLVRILGNDGLERYVPLVRDPQVEEYDIIVDEAPATADRREEVFALLMQVVPWLLKSGIPIPPDILDYIPLPSTLAVKWKAMLQGDPQEQKIRKMAEVRTGMAAVKEAEGKAAKAAADAKLSEEKAQDVKERRIMDAVDLGTK